MKIVEIESNNNPAQVEHTLNTWAGQGYVVVATYTKGNKILFVMQKQQAD